MKLAAKREPTAEALQKAYTEGFDYTELYLTKSDLDSMETTIATIYDAQIESVAAHTPHVTTDQTGYIDKTVRLSQQLGIFTVFHSSSIFINDALAYGKRFDYPFLGYEHDPGFSRHGIENLILERGGKLVLDTAHLFTGSQAYLEDLKQLLKRTDHLHFCDSTPQRDGLPIGHGDMDMQRTACMIQESSYDGYVVLEVMPEHQPEALNKVQSYWNMC